MTTRHASTPRAAASRVSSIVSAVFEEPVPAMTFARAPTSVNDTLEQVELLAVRERWGFAGRPGDDETIGSMLDEMGGESPSRRHIQRAIGSERGHHGGENLSETWRS